LFSIFVLSSLQPAVPSRLQPDLQSSLSPHLQSYYLFSGMQASFLSAAVLLPFLPAYLQSQYLLPKTELQTTMFATLASAKNNSEAAIAASLLFINQPVS
jgi:hypothetical protein